MDKKEIEKYSGENEYRRAPRLDLDEIRLDGDRGIFVQITRVGKNFIKNDIGVDEMRLIMLRIKKKLVCLEDCLTTSEFGSNNDEVMLFTPSGNKKGIVSELRKEYPSLRTHQIVYSLLDNELVKLTIKGASLGSELKPETSTGFYDYLSKFPDDEHIWEYQTILKPERETNKMKKTYFAINFIKGEKVEDLNLVGEKMKFLNEFFEKLDSFYQNRKKRLPDIEELLNVETVSVGDDIKNYDEVPVIEQDKEVNLSDF